MSARRLWVLVTHLPPESSTAGSWSRLEQLVGAQLEAWTGHPSGRPTAQPHRSFAERFAASQEYHQRG